MYVPLQTYVYIYIYSYSFISVYIYCTLCIICMLALDVCSASPKLGKKGRSGESQRRGGEAHAEKWECFQQKSH